MAKNLIQRHLEKLPQSETKDRLLTYLETVTAEISIDEPHRSTRAFTSENSKDALLRSVFASSNSVCQSEEDILSLCIHHLAVEAGLKYKGEQVILERARQITMFTGVYDVLSDKSSTIVLQVSSSSITTYATFMSEREDAILELKKEDYIKGGKISDEAFSQLRQIVGDTLRKSFLFFLPSNDVLQKPTKRTDLHEESKEQRANMKMDIPSIPSVGQADAFPFRKEGGVSFPGMEVGPDHPIFTSSHEGGYRQGGYAGSGSRKGPTGGFPAPPDTFGPVPGARYDPFGPVQPSPFRNPRGDFPSARVPPFGGPSPDHLRMPRNEEDRPFGSDFSFM